MKEDIKKVLDDFFDVDGEEHVIFVNEKDTDLLADAINDAIIKKVNCESKN